MSIPENKLKQCMDGIENRIKHAYNCGWTDGYQAAEEKFAASVAHSIMKAVEDALERRGEDE